MIGKHLKIFTSVQLQLALSVEDATKRLGLESQSRLSQKIESVGQFAAHAAGSAERYQRAGINVCHGT
jgi:hypothetical protein